MKTHFLIAILGLTVAFGLHAQTPAAKSKSPPPDSPKFKIDLVRQVTPDITALSRQVEAVARRHKLGQVTQEELQTALSALEIAQHRTPSLLNIESLGGSLGEFANIVSSSDQMSVTIINAGEPSDLETTIPPFSLRNANLGTVVNVLATFLHARGLELKTVGGDNPHPPDAKHIVCMLRRLEASPEQKERAAATDFESIQLDEHIHGAQTIEAIVDAIRTAWELDPARDPAALRLKFHPPTKILLVSGPSPTSQIVRQVVSGLRKSPVQR